MGLCRRDDDHAVHFADKIFIICGEPFGGQAEFARRLELLVTNFGDIQLDGLDAASDRLRNFVQKAAQATLAGEVFDDAATGQGLLNYFLRAMNCGAMTESEAVEMSGLTLEELRGKSFARILKARS